jgi:hypothetical protein
MLMDQLHRQGVILNALMLAALVAGLSGPFHRFLSSWDPRYLVGACFIVALTAGLIHQTFRRDRMWTSELLRYVLPELLLLLVIMRVITTLSVDVSTLAADIARWFYDPLGIFDLGMVAGLVVGLLVAVMAHQSAQNLADLTPSTSDIPPVSGEDLIAGRVLSEERTVALARISRRFVFGGVLLLLALALEVVNVQRLTGPSLPLSNLSAVAALCYLISGLLLYSQARLALLQSRWQFDGARVSEHVVRRWTRASWLFVGGIVLVALVLPRTYAMGLLDTLRAALGLLGYGITLVGYLLVWLFSLVALLPAWLLSLLTLQSESSAEALAPPRLIAPPPPQVVHQPQFVPALLFWVCMLVLVGYALAIVVRRYPVPFRRLLSYGVLGALRAWLRARWASAQALSQAVGERVRRRSPEQAPPAARRSRLRLGQLGPRDLVRYFYRSVLRQAAARGLSRRRGQTPYEYAEQLGRDLPEARSDIRELTDVFVEARYSRRAISVQRARRTRHPWERLRRMLNGARRAR